MGNYLSSKPENILEERINKLQELIDQNNDNIVTKDELKQYVKKQINNKDETEKWKAAYEKLHNEHIELLKEYEKTLVIPREIKKSHVSISALQDHIQNEIISTDANLKYIPDFLERQAYLSAYKTLMMSMAGLCNTTSVDIMNHRLSFILEPIPTKKENN